MAEIKKKIRQVVKKMIRENENLDFSFNEYSKLWMHKTLLKISMIFLQSHIVDTATNIRWLRCFQGCPEVAKIGGGSDDFLKIFRKIPENLSKFSKNCRKIIGISEKFLKIIEIFEKFLRN